LATPYQPLERGPLGLRGISGGRVLRRRCSIDARTAGLMGFSMYSLTLDSWRIISTIWRSILRPVMTMIGTVFASPIWSSFNTSKPLWPGSMKSSTTRSGERVSTFRMASCPSAAHSVRNPSFVTANLRKPRMPSSSSTRRISLSLGSDNCGGKDKSGGTHSLIGQPASPAGASPVPSLRLFLWLASA